MQMTPTVQQRSATQERVGESVAPAAWLLRGRLFTALIGESVDGQVPRDQAVTEPRHRH